MSIEYLNEILNPSLAFTLWMHGYKGISFWYYKQDKFVLKLVNPLTPRSD